MANQMSGTPYASPQAVLGVPTGTPYKLPTVTPEQTPTDIPVQPTATVRPTITPVKYAMPPAYYAELLLVENMGFEAFGKAEDVLWKRKFYAVLDKLIDLSVDTLLYEQTVLLKGDFLIGIELMHDPTIEEALENIVNLKEIIK